MKEMQNSIWAQGKARKKPIQVSTIGPAHSMDRIQAQEEAHQCEGVAELAQAHPRLGRGWAPTSTSWALLAPISSFNVVEDGEGVYSGNIPLEPTSHLLYKQKLTPSLQTLIHTQASEEEPQSLASS
jgi:hypothetical protein